MTQRLFLNSINEWNSDDSVLSVLGPTASGKTSTVLNFVKERFSSHLKTPLLVSLDAVAVYEKLDIGSAKPINLDREDFDWEGLDLASPSKNFTAADFVRAVSLKLNLAMDAKRPIILVGGSHFYEKMLVEGSAPGEASDPEFMKSLEKLSNEFLHQQLKDKDFRWAERVHLNDRYRLTRFTDLVFRQNLCWEDLFEQKKDGGGIFQKIQKVNTLILGLEKKDHDQERILKRIHQMLEAGWIEEVQSLIEEFSLSAPALRSVGYREIVDYLVHKKVSLKDLAQWIATSHRQLAKKQRTWLRGLVCRV
jgi:tRNA dimethylallyltransferase